jgi:hypothetical protein
MVKDLSLPAISSKAVLEIARAGQRRFSSNQLEAMHRSFVS